MKKRTKLTISIVVLCTIVSASVFFYFAHGEAALIAQTSNMFMLRRYITNYAHKYGSMPKNLAALKLDTSTNSLTDNIGIENIKYPAVSCLFHEKEPRWYGFKKGRFFVYKDGDVQFVLNGDGPPKKTKPARLVKSVEYYDGKDKKIHFVKHYDKGVPTKIIEYYKTGSKKSQELYENGKKHGVCTVWDEAGKVLEKKYYKDGVLQTNPTKTTQSE